MRIKNKKLSLYRSLFTLLVVFFAASCTYSGGSKDPVIRKFTWFSYVNGDDIRKVCADLGADRYRFVYNGIYQRQTRSYDVFFHSKKIAMHVTGPANLKKMNINDGFAVWRGTREDLLVGKGELNIIKKALIASAALQPAPEGLRLYSDKFHWVVSACVEGKFYFNAYLWNTERWDQMQFDDLLFALDVTGVELEVPHDYSPIEVWGGLDKAEPFLLEVGKNGLVGYPGS